MKRASALIVALALFAAVGPSVLASTEPEQVRPWADRIAVPEGPDPLPVAPDTIGVRSSVASIAGGSIRMVGEVQSRITERREFVEVRGTIYNASDDPIGDVTERIWIEGLAFGSVSSFALVRPAPPGTSSYSVAVVDDGNRTIGAPNIIDLTLEPVVIDPVALTRTYAGTVLNPADAPLNAHVNVTTFDGGGNVLDAGRQAVALCGRCGGNYSIQILYDPNVPVAKAAVSADGRTSSGGYVASLDHHFNDLGITPFKDDILWLFDSGIASGCGSGRFCPTRSVRRDEMASFLSRAKGLTAPAPDAFVDDTANLHELQINRIAAAGITTGCAPQLYCPADPVRRDTMASFLARALALTGEAPDAFTDDTGNFHEPNINRLAQAGISNGCGAGKFCPAGLVTREQMAAFLRRAFDD